MWDQGGQPWPQWPLSQQQWMQSFQHQQDPGQVDWAALAQAWIAQKESTGTPVDQQPLQPNGQEVQNLEPVPNNHGNFQNDPSFNRMWQPEWGMHGQPPPPPPEQAWIPPGPGPMEVAPPSEDSNSQDSLEFGSDALHGSFPQNSHGFSNTPDSFSMAPMAVNQFDYQHGAAAFGPPSTGFHPPYWQQGPPQNRRDRPPAFRERQRSPMQLPKQEPPALDAVKRRTLPAWIREGLEKMDREKQKKLEKERMERQRAEMVKDEERESDLAEEEGDGPRLPRKSKFDSDDEDEEQEEEEVRAPVRKKEFVSRSPSPPVEDQSEPEMTEEEREFQLMLLTKTLLTEVLLEVTNEEIFQVAKETHRKATKEQLWCSLAYCVLCCRVRATLSAIFPQWTDTGLQKDERPQSDKPISSSWRSFFLNFFLSFCFL
ncbi:arginine/serine-rich protein PNISR isoform X3 [Anguilla anguilla]|uniref:arginine/serine-rich protein PNISR isoform X3 n=1 Tax=Anguilla anguilla TaxID=7936 RepID=UPI0015AD907E|nr:arginine/serine-rich protein PNISR isoform X3 [Anguilla anguilla]